MGFPGIDEIKQTFAQLPILAMEEVQVALHAAEKSLPEGKLEQLLDSLNAALRTYLIDRLWQLWAEKAPAAKISREVERIAAAADRLIELLGISDASHMPPDPLGLILRRQAELHAESATEVGAMYYSGSERVSESLQGVLLLRKLLHEGYAYERMKVTPSRARREGDQAMRQLFGRINAIWLDSFNEVPGAGWDAHRGEASGPYVRFVVAVFRVVREKLPEEMGRRHPKFDRGITLNANAVRARFRNSDVPRRD